MESKRYKKLLKAQQLIQRRDQALLAQGLSEEARLESEKKELFKMSSQDAKGLLIDHLWIVNKIRKNSVHSGAIKEFINVQQGEVKKSNRRYDLLVDKHKEYSDKENRKTMSFMIAEYLTNKKD